MIDWETFRARVQAGTRVRDEWGTQSILLETYPWISVELAIRINAECVSEDIEHECDEMFAEELMCQPFSYLNYTNSGEFVRVIGCEPKTLKYLIDGRWLSYDELMGGDTL